MEWPMDELSLQQSQDKKFIVQISALSRLLAKMNEREFKSQ